jgi:hypothetical protein
MHTVYCGFYALTLYSTYIETIYLLIAPIRCTQVPQIALEALMLIDILPVFTWFTDFLEGDAHSSYILRIHMTNYTYNILCCALCTSGWALFVDPACSGVESCH